MRYFLNISYNGATFHGWQSQPNAISVQEVIENALSVIFRQSIPIVGAGRTDTGVNAREMFAHCDLPEINDKKRLLISLNKLVGPDISLNDILKVDDAAHARFDAIERTYKYFILFGKNPFLSPYSFLSQRHLDIELMNRAASVLLETSDFTSFAKLHSDAKTNICNVTRAVWQKWSPSFALTDSKDCEGIVFTISADRFLRNMVRAIVGTLIQVGNGKIGIKEFEEIIKKKDRCAAGTSMPPQGLFLWKIRYPYI